MHRWAQSGKQCLVVPSSPNFPSPPNLQLLRWVPAEQVKEGACPHVSNTGFGGCPGKNSVASIHHSPGVTTPCVFLEAPAFSYRTCVPAKDSHCQSVELWRDRDSGCEPCSYPALGWERDGDTAGCPGRGQTDVCAEILHLCKAFLRCEPARVERSVSQSCCHAGSGDIRSQIVHVACKQSTTEILHLSPGISFHHCKRAVWAILLIAGI